MGRKKKMLYEDLPVYEIVVNDDDNTGIRYISIVENPAIEISGYAFSADTTEEEKQMAFSVNTDEQVIAGPAMIPGKKIYRNDNGMEYYVVFTPDTIKHIVQKFVRDNNNKSINVEHSNTMVQAYIQEHWMVADPVYDKSKAYGFDLPVGTWFVCVKIEDESFWNNEVKQLNKMGFSIEGILGQKLMYMASQEEQFTMDQVLETLTEEEIEYIFGVLDLPPDNMNSRWHTHPNCKCSYNKGVWNYVYDGEYPCDICKEVGAKYEKVWRAGMPGSGRFSAKQKISFDYHQTLNTTEGKQLATKLINEGNDIHIVTNANERESGPVIQRVAKEVGIPETNIHYANGDKVGVLKELGIKTHYDNNPKEIEAINNAGLNGKLF